MDINKQLNRILLKYVGGYPGFLEQRRGAFAIAEDWIIFVMHVPGKKGNEQLNFHLSRIVDIQLEKSNKANVPGALVFGVVGALMPQRVIMITFLGDDGAANTAVFQERGTELTDEIRKAFNILVEAQREYNTRTGTTPLQTTQFTQSAQGAQPVQQPTIGPDEKVCPFCAEIIKANAIKCRYCGSMLDGSE